MKITQKTGSVSPIMHFIVSIGIGFTIGYGSYLIQEGTITGGNFVSFIAALIMLYTPLKSLGNNMKSVQMSLLALERVTGKLDAPEYIVDKPDAKVFSGLEQDIGFENISFEYKKVFRY